MMAQETEPTPLQIIQKHGLESHLSLLMEGTTPVLPDQTVAESVDDMLAYCQRRDTPQDSRGMKN